MPDWSLVNGMSGDDETDDFGWTPEQRGGESEGKWKQMPAPLKLKVSEALTWDQLADKYDKMTGGCARTKQMDDVFEWAERNTDTFHVDAFDGTLHLILK